MTAIEVARTKAQDIDQHDRRGGALSGRSTASLAALGLGVVIVFSILIALGTWQLYRRTWKLDLIASVDARVDAPPSSPPGPTSWWRLTKSADEYRHVRVRGVFLSDRDTEVQAVTELGAGSWVLVPFVTDGFTILVNRGFVPPERRDPSTRTAGQITGETIVTGLLRMSEPKGAFLRNNDPTAGYWYSRDVAAIAKARAIGSVAPYFIDADSTPNRGGYPVGGLTVITFPNNHLVYALTWYGLATMLAGAVAWIVRDERRLHDSGCAP